MDPFKTRCNTSQEAVLKIDPPVDADGNVVVLDADAVVLEKVSGEATGTVTRNADGSYEVVLRSPGNVGDPPQPGTTTFNLKGDALPGEGVEIIEQQLVLEVVNVAAVAFGGITVAAVRTKSNV